MKRTIALTLAGVAATAGFAVMSTAPASAVNMYRDSTCDGTYCYFERSTDNGRSWTMIGWRFQTMAR